MERPVLGFLVRRIPLGVQPDHMTWLGLAGALLAFAAYVMAPSNGTFLWLASFGLIVNWAGDSLDGTLARHRGIERANYGFFIDHTTDLFAQMLIGFGLALSGQVRFEAGATVLIVYLAAVAATFIRERATGVLRITVMHIGPTEVRLSLIALNTMFVFVPRERLLVGMTGYSIVDLLFFGFGVLTILALGVATIRTARHLNREDK